MGSRKGQKHYTEEIKQIVVENNEKESLSIH